MMNPAIGKAFTGLDDTGNPVSGIIERVAKYAKGSVPVSYAIRPYPNEGGRVCAVVAAKTVQEHIDGLALVASMDSEK